MLVALAASALVFGCGAAVEALPGLWKVLPVIAGLLIAVPIGTWMTGNFPQTLAVRAFVGVSCVAIVAYMGGLEAENVGRAGVTQACRSMGVVLLLGLAVAGCWLAVRYSWFSRNASWVVPGLLTLLPLTLPWLGGLLNAVYLSDGFGIPVSSIDIPYYWTFAVALEPAGIAGLFVMLFIGLVGWVRHFHHSSVSRGAMAVAVPVLCVVYVLTAILVGMQGAAKAAGRAADDVSGGRTPDRYFGLQGQLMCLIPLNDEVPVFNGPLPTGHPVLTFGGSGDQLWAWDPLRPKGRDGSQQAVGFATADVALVQPRAGSCRGAKA
ncbi:hypothetical protein ABUW04_31165 [Streptacidiphilus sp. N1-10]|uniref:Uncharacterized protein n=1 Tax=Streptacidiphilus jeojiensis TaxID=3229225 RepID=A0ABV6XWR8_9ACTN